VVSGGRPAARSSQRARLRRGSHARRRPAAALRRRWPPGVPCAGLRPDHSATGRTIPPPAEFGGGMVRVRKGLAALPFRRVIRPFRHFANSPHTLAPHPGAPFGELAGSTKGRARALFGTRGGAFALRAGLPSRRPKEARADRSDHLARSAYKELVSDPNGTSAHKPFNDNTIG